MKSPRPSSVHKTHPVQDLSAGKHDAYRATAKLAQGTCCPDCGVVFADGRWQWLKARQDAPRERCPACMRIHDQFPAGYINLTGAYIYEHRTELLAIVRNLELKERSEHPMQRIMKIEEDHDKMQITTTDVHLARAIGDALRRAHGGSLDVKYSADDNVVRVVWTQ